MSEGERRPLIDSDAAQHGDYTQLSDSEAATRDEQNGPQDRPQSFAKIVLPMAAGIFLTALDQTIVVSSYTAIGNDLNALQNVSWVATAYLLTMTSFQPLYGKLSDIFGRKRCLIFAYSIFTVGCLLCGLSRNIKELVISRAIAGVGGGGMQTLVSIIVSDLVPLRQRGTWQGVLNIVFATGSAAGASLGGYIADSLGWRWSFLLQVPIALFAIVSVSWNLELPLKDLANFATGIRRVDFGGAITLVLAVFFLLFGLDRGGNDSWSDHITIASLTGALVFFVLFSIIELRLAAEPFAPRRIIVNRSLIASYLVNLFGIASGFTVLFHAPLYLQAVLNKTASEVGKWLVLSVAGSLFGSLGGGLFIQATGKYFWITFVAYITMLAGTVAVLLASGWWITSAIILAIGIFLCSIGNGTGITTSLISLIANAGPEDQAIATAVSYLFRSLGSVTAISVGSSLVQSSLRSSLREKLSGADADEIARKVRQSLAYLDELDPVTRAIVVDSYEKAIHVTLLFATGLAACAVVSAAFIKEKPIPKRN